MGLDSAGTGILERVPLCSDVKLDCDLRELCQMKSDGECMGGLSVLKLALEG